MEDVVGKGRAYPIFVRMWRRIGEPISDLVALFRNDLACGMRSPLMAINSSRRASNNAHMHWPLCLLPR